MRIDLLFIQLAVVFLPGLIWTQLAATYAMKERPTPADFLIRAFIFGLLRELLLRDAIIWDKNGDGIDVPLLYVARPDTDLHIEFPYQEA